MNPPMRVAVVARAVYPLHGRGGLERSVHDLVRHLARLGVELTVITQPPTASAEGEARGATPQNGRAAEPWQFVEGRPAVTWQFVPYRTFPLAGRRGTTILDRNTAYPVFGLRAGNAAWELVRSGRADIVHGFGASVLGYARRRWMSNAPLVLNPQGLEEFGGTDPARARSKRMAYFPLRVAVTICARAADRVIATDRSLEPFVRSHLGVPADRIAVIPNALDLEIVDRLASADDGRRMRAGAGVPEADVVVLSVGRLEENKGFHVLARALGALASHSGAIAEGRWRWVLVGEGPFRPEIERAVRAAGIAGRVLMTGRLADRDLHAWYEAADVFVHPTLYEGSSLVTLEAMAHRRAVVATRAGGLPDKVRSGVNGWLVEPGDAGALSAALSGALAEPVRLRAFGAAGRRIVEEAFAWPAVAARTLTLYHELLEPRREPDASAGERR